jgi:hypothetical protein
MSRAIQKNIGRRLMAAKAPALTVQQGDELDEIHRLVQALGIAILGTTLDTYQRPALSALARLVDDRLTALTEGVGVSP